MTIINYNKYTVTKHSNPRNLGHPPSTSIIIKSAHDLSSALHVLKERGGLFDTCWHAICVSHAFRFLTLTRVTFCCGEMLWVRLWLRFFIFKLSPLLVCGPFELGIFFLFFLRLILRRNHTPTKHHTLFKP